MKKYILVVDSNPVSRREIRESLQDERCTEVCCVKSVEEALNAFQIHRFCLVIVDIGLAGESGKKLLNIMSHAQPIPILVLSGRDDSLKKASLFRAGASACMEKPYDLEEFLAQAQSLMELYVHANPVESRCYTLVFGQELVIDPAYWSVTLKGERLDLTHREFNLLYCLAKHKGQVLTKEQLYSMIWNEDSEINPDATIKSHIHSLRQKLSPCGRHFIENVRGVGYRFNIELAETE